MAVTFNEVSAQGITFASITGGATIRNIRYCAVLSAPSGLNEALFLAGASEFTALYLNYNGVYDAGKFEFQANFSGNNGIWDTTNDVLLNGYNEIFITYDGGATTNDPVFYLNGVSVAVTERVTPTGTIDTEASINSVVGAVSSGSPKGSVLAVQYYTGRVITAAEVLEAYNSRLAIPNYSGLVFSPNLNGAAGLQTFDGATLSGTNYIRDTISGATGTPSGSPVGAADTYLNWK